MFKKSRKREEKKRTRNSGLRVFAGLPVDRNFHARAACERKRYEYWVPVSFFMEDGGLVSNCSHAELLRDSSLEGWTRGPGSADNHKLHGASLSLEPGSHLLVRELPESLNCYALSGLQFEIALKFSGKATCRVALRQAGNWFMASCEQMLTETAYLLGDLQTKKWRQYDPSTRSVVEVKDEDSSEGGPAWSDPLDAFGLLVHANEAQTLSLERVRVLGPATARSVAPEGDRLALLAALKPILKKLTLEDRSFHNFSRGVSSHEPRANRAIRIQCLGFLQVNLLSCGVGVVLVLYVVCVSICLSFSSEGSRDRTFGLLDICPSFLICNAM